MGLYTYARILPNSNYFEEYTMKKVLLILSTVLASSAFAADTWYAYCVAHKEDVRYCTTPEVKTDDTRARCLAFGQDMGASKYEIYSGTDLGSLEASMSEHCDEVKGPEHGDLYACQYETFCKNAAPKVIHLASRVYATTKKTALDRCLSNNEGKIKLRLKEQSEKDCYLRIVVDKIQASNLNGTAFVK